MSKPSWDGIVSRGAAPRLTEAQKTELDRRLADHLANPNDVISRSEVKAAAIAKNVEEAWEREADRREGELESGSASTVSGQEAVARLRARIQRRPTRSK
jgi:putative addiction module component (TIGR02574 family)